MTSFSSGPVDPRKVARAIREEFEDLIGAAPLTDNDAAQEEHPVAHIDAGTLNAKAITDRIDALETRLDAREGRMIELLEIIAGALTDDAPPPNTNGRDPNTNGHDPEANEDLDL